MDFNEKKDQKLNSFCKTSIIIIKYELLKKK